MNLLKVDEVIGDYSGRSRSVLDYCLVMERMMVQSKESGFNRNSWAPLADLVDVEQFERIGNFKEVMDWKGYLDFLTSWAMGSEWECSFKRITELGNIVFLELEERARIDDFANVVDSISVYEFNEAEKICHVDVYLQMEPLPADIHDAIETP